ncbi:hypothetical protein [Roseateles chitinivorans]|uniref:hypothetical protein n=1 Tax=Roseateles chitinivorans TaxID=2917965 RepID=UPI003D672A73
MMKKPGSDSMSPPRCRVLQNRRPDSSGSYRGAFEQAIANSPRMQAQRMVIQSLFGPTGHSRNDASHQLKIDAEDAHQTETATSLQEAGRGLVSIEASPVRVSSGSKPPAQLVFAVELGCDSEGEGENEVFRISEVRIGERPPTQFGTKQEDHVWAWSMKVMEVRRALLAAPNLHDSMGQLMAVVDATNSVTPDEGFGTLMASIQKSYNASKNQSLKLFNVLQRSTREFLEIYNRQERTAVKRIGAADRSEGPRVRGANAALSTILEDGRPDAEAVSEFCRAMMDMLDLKAYKSNELIKDRKNGYVHLSNIIERGLLSALSMADRTEMAEKSGDITVRLIEMIQDLLGIKNSGFGAIVLGNLKNNHLLLASIVDDSDTDGETSEGGDFEGEENAEGDDDAVEPSNRGTMLRDSGFYQDDFNYDLDDGEYENKDRGIPRSLLNQRFCLCEGAPSRGEMIR